MYRPCTSCGFVFRQRDEVWLSVYQQAPPTVCQLCRSLERLRASQNGRGVIQATPMGRVDPVSRKPRAAHGDTTRRWTQAEALAAIYQWATVRQRFPVSDHFDSDSTLPTSPTVRRLFGDFATCKAEFRKHYPDLAHMAPPDRWTSESILAVLAEFWQTHHRPALAIDLRREPLMPNPRTIYERFGGLEKAYHALAKQGVDCLKAYYRDAAVVRRQASRNGYAKKMAR